MPTCGEWTSLALAVTDDAAGQQVRIVEDRAGGMRHGIAQFSAFMDRSRRLRGGMTGYPSWKRELLEQLFHSLFILTDVGIKLRVGSLQVGIRHHTWPAVSRAADIDYVQVILLYQPVEMHIYKVESGSRPPMPQQ